MKHLIIFVLFYFNTMTSFAQMPNDDLSFFNYCYAQSIIKTNRIETVIIETSFNQKKNSSKLIFKFDDNGLLKSESIYDSTNVIKREFYFQTNSHNDLVLRIEKDYESNRVDTVQYFKLYEGNKLLKDSSTEIPISYSYEYRSDGKLIKTSIVSNFGLGNKTKRVILNTYDSLNRISNRSETFFKNDHDSTGTVISDRNFFYTDIDKLQKEVEKMDGANSLIGNNGSIEYVYDSRGNLTQLLRKNAASCFYTYNKKGLITTKKMVMKLAADGFNRTETKVESIEKFSYTSF